MWLDKTNAIIERNVLSFFFKKKKDKSAACLHTYFFSSEYGTGGLLVKTLNISSELNVYSAHRLNK